MVKDYIARKESGRNLALKHELIRENFKLSYYAIMTKENPVSILKKHKTFINILELNLKKSHPNIIALQNYINTKNKSYAFANLTQYANNRSIFS